MMKSLQPRNETHLRQKTSIKVAQYIDEEGIMFLPRYLCAVADKKDIACPAILKHKNNRRFLRLFF